MCRRAGRAAPRCGDPTLVDRLGDRDRQHREPHRHSLRPVRREPATQVPGADARRRGVVGLHVGLQLVGVVGADPLPGGLGVIRDDDVEGPGHPRPLRRESTLREPRQVRHVTASVESEDSHTHCDRPARRCAVPGSRARGAPPPARAPGPPCPRTAAGEPRPGPGRCRRTGGPGLARTPRTPSARSQDRGPAPGDRR